MKKAAELAKLGKHVARVAWEAHEIGIAPIPLSPPRIAMLRVGRKLNASEWGVVEDSYHAELKALQEGGAA